MDSLEIKRLDRAHHLHSWSIQGAIDPMVFDHGKGACFWDGSGKRYIDFFSQQVNLNTGFQHPKVVKAIQEQAERLCYCAPGFAYEKRSELAHALSKVTPGDLDRFFFTLSGAESNENAIKMARSYTGKFKILARYRSYHGASYGAVTLTGDPRRPPVEPGIPGVVHVLDPYCYRCSFALSYPRCGLQCAKHIEEIIQYEGPETVAGLFLETVTGSNGLFVPPPEYMPMVREICDRHKVLMICDEVMSGFGRTGRWFAVEHWDVVPDMITMAKGLTSGYVPLGAVALSGRMVDHFQDHMLWCGLTYNAHPLACGTAVATLRVYEEEGLIDRSLRLGGILMAELDRMKEKHPSVGDVRGLGLFSVVELVKDRETREPLVPWNAGGSALGLTKEITRRLLAGGVYTWVRWNWIFVTPPLVISEEELMEGLGVVDEVLSFVDTQLG
jgi:taurine---2-oxoglutarate transaminase